MKMGRMAALMGAILASDYNGPTRAAELKPAPPLVPYNKTRATPAPATSNRGAAKDRRAATKRRSIKAQKRHPNCRSAK